MLSYLERFLRKIKNFIENENNIRQNTHNKVRRGESMEFNNTKTYQNLLNSFAGECMAGMHYQSLADKALNLGYVSLSNELKKIAKNETMHAKQMDKFILQYGGEKNNVIISSGYPTGSETLENGLRRAIESENNEATKIYISYAHDARVEGYEDVAKLYELIANVEKIHVEKFSYLSKAFESEMLYKSKTEKVYTCSMCGHTFKSYEAWDKCPLCESSQGLVEIEYPCEEKNEKLKND